MNRADRGLDLIDAGPVTAEAGMQNSGPFFDLGRIPQDAILTFERDLPALRIDPRARRES